MDPQALEQRLSTSLLGAADALTVVLGERLGLYAALAGGGPTTADALAAATGTQPRLVREWLEQQAVAGFVGVDDPDADPAARCFHLPAEHVPLLADPDHVGYFPPFLAVLAAAGERLTAVEQAFRSGGGVAWSAYGDEMRRAQGEANRPLLLQVLPQHWLPLVPGLVDRLRSGARVADIGAGEGWASIGIARAYPQAVVDAYDVDPASVVAARRHATEAGVADRVRVHAEDVARSSGDGAHDLVLAVECVHDLPDPVAVLAAMRAMVAPGGTVLVVDERVPDRFTGPGDAMEHLFYAYSVLVCLPDSLSHPGSVGTGTVMRRGTLETYARAAGFARVEEVEVDDETFRLHRLVT